MRIGFFSECYHPIVNGVVASIDASREGLQNAGHEVLIVTPNVPYYQDAETAVVRLPSLALPSSSGYRLTLPVTTRALDARAGAPFDVVHAHSQFITGGLAMRYARAHRVPLVFTYHTRLDYYAHYAPLESGAARRVLAAWTRAFANRAAAVVAPTDETRRYLASIGVRTPVAVVPSAIDLARFRGGRRRGDLRARLGADPGSALVLCVGRLAPEKNPALALAVCAAAGPHLRLAFVGDGPLRRPLEREGERRGVAGRVSFAGAIAPADMPDVYASADALLFTSVSETQGLVLIEALAAGLPIVAVDVPQTREVIGDGGFLAPPDAAALAAALAGAIATERTQSAIQVALERFSIDEQARGLVAVYEAARAGTT